MRLAGMQTRRFLVAGIVALAWLGCSDDPAGPPPPAPRPPDSPELILSNPTGAGTTGANASVGGGGATRLAYVSLPPGTVSGAQFVVIRNITAGGLAAITVPVVEGGFDPVAFAADAGDQLVLEFHGGGGILGRKYGTVPVSRPPTVVRISPPKGRTDVALSVRPGVVFSEPVDAASLDGMVRLLHGTAPVDGEAVTSTTDPWAVEFIPTLALAPESAYVVDIAQGVLDLDGDALESGVQSDFTTAASPPDPEPEPDPEPDPVPPPPPTRVTEVIAFSREGDIWVMHADGSGPRQLTSGEGWDDEPTWSPDGLWIAFTRYRHDLGYPSTGNAAIYRINADGAGLVRLSAASDSTWDAHPSWSPDGSRIAFTTLRDTEVVDWFRNLYEIYAMRPDGSDPVRLTRHGALAFHPSWSPDGLEIAYMLLDQAGGGLRRINADGSSPMPIGVPNAEPSYYFAPSWTPDGLRILSRTFGCLEWDESNPEGPDCILWEGPHLTVIGLDGLNPTRLSNYVVNVDETFSTPAWSPDGGAVAFTQSSCTIEMPSCPPIPEWVEVLRLSDGSITRLTDGSSPAWRIAP